MGNGKSYHADHQRKATASRHQTKQIFLEQEYYQGRKAQLIMIKMATHQEDLILNIHASNNRSMKQNQ